MSANDSGNVSPPSSAKPKQESCQPDCCTLWRGSAHIYTVWQKKRHGTILASEILSNFGQFEENRRDSAIWEESGRIEGTKNRADPTQTEKKCRVGPRRRCLYSTL